MVGAALTTIVTVKAHEAVLPDVSMAVQVTVVAPSGNGAPDAGLHDTVTDSYMSVALALGNVTAVSDCPLTGGACTLAGHVMVGGTLLATMTRNEHAFCSPALSVVVHETDVVAASGNCEPEGGEHVVDAMPERLLVDTLKATVA